MRGNRCVKVLHGEIRPVIAHIAPERASPSRNKAKSWNTCTTLWVIVVIVDAWQDKITYRSLYHTTLPGVDTLLKTEPAIVHIITEEHILQ